LGNGAGGFAAPAIFSVGTYPRAVAVADFNKDGNLDVAVANGLSDDVTALFGDGKGDLVNPVEVPLVPGGAPAALATGDFNGDGNPDLAVAMAGTDLTAVLYGDGHGNFTVDTIQTVQGSFALAAGSFDGSGLTGLAVSSFSANQVIEIPNCSLKF